MIHVDLLHQLLHQGDGITPPCSGARSRVGFSPSRSPPATGSVPKDPPLIE